MRITTNQIYLRGLNNMMDQQTRVNKYLEQSSGKRVQTAADDPIAAAQISLMRQRIESTTQLEKNRSTAESTLSLQESVLYNGVNVLQRIRELQVQAGNNSLSESDRKSLGDEISVLLDQMLDLGNSKDSNGNYLFSGSKTETTAFTKTGSGQFTYNGDDFQRFQSVSSGAKIAISDPGSDIFMRIKNGNGTFTVSQIGNTGTASSTSGSLVDATAYIPDNYTLQFALNSSNQMVYLVSGASTGAVIPLTGNVDDAPLYQSGQTVSFNGMEITLSGDPVAGDSFSIAPAANESIFSTISRMVTNLNKPFVTASDKANTQTEHNQLLDQLDSGLNNLLDFQAKTGARLNQLQMVEQLNGDVIQTSTDTMSQLEDADMAEVAVQLNLQMIYLQAAQQSFVRIQNLSVFNYL